MPVAVVSQNWSNRPTLGFRAPRATRESVLDQEWRGQLTEALRGRLHRQRELVLTEEDGGNPGDLAKGGLERIDGGCDDRVLKLGKAFEIL